MGVFTNRWLQRAIGLEKFLFISTLIKYFTLDKKSNELQFVKLLRVINKREGVILDVGAGQGLQTISFAKEFPDCHVYALDPVIHNVKVIEKQKIFYKLKNIKVIQKALGNTNGICELVIEKDSDSNYNLSCRLRRQEDAEDNLDNSSVINKIDSLEEIRNHSVPLIAIHINTAKFEWAVLQGGLDIIRRDKPVIFCQLTDKYNKVIILSILKQIGYIPLVLEQGRLDYYDSRMHMEESFIFIHRTFKLDPLSELNLLLS